MEYLKENPGSSLHVKGRWMIWDFVNNEWNVYQRKSSGSELVYFGIDLKEALKVLN